MVFRLLVWDPTTQRDDQRSCYRHKTSKESIVPHKKSQKQFQEFTNDLTQFSKLIQSLQTSSND
jgi:hypothetical protein